MIKADNYQLPSKQMFLLFSVKPNMQTTLFLYITAKQWLTNWYLLIQCYITHKGIANIQRSLNLEMSSPILHYIDESISNALWCRTIIWSTETLIPFYSGESSNTICCRCPRRKHITSHTILMTLFLKKTRFLSIITQKDHLNSLGISGVRQRHQLFHSPMLWYLF